MSTEPMAPWPPSPSRESLPDWTRPTRCRSIPHKWLYQPLDCGCLLYRDAGAARAPFRTPETMPSRCWTIRWKASRSSKRSIELSRRFRALKLWLSLRYHGLANFREAIGNDLEMAQHLAASSSRNEPELELLAPVPLSAVCFRYRAGAADARCDALNQKILQRVIRRGKVFLSNATIHGQFALRACIVNHRTTPADVEQVVSEVIAVGRELTAKGRTVNHAEPFQRNSSSSAED